MLRFDARYNVCSPPMLRSIAVKTYQWSSQTFEVLTWPRIIAMVPESQWILHQCFLEPELEAVIRREFPGENPRDKLHPDQKAQLVSIVAGYNVFVTGCAGTGKSKMVASARLTLERVMTVCQQSMIVCASTGVSAFNVSGATVHSALLFHVNIEAKWHAALKNKYTDLRSLFLDEISMISPMNFLLMHQRLSWLAIATGAPWVLDQARDVHGVVPCGGYQIVVVGDFFQLPPVEKKFTGIDKDRQQRMQDFANRQQFVGLSPEYEALGAWSQVFQTPLWAQLVPWTVNLTHTQRQRDAKFVAWLMRIRYGTMIEYDAVRFYADHYCEEARVPDSAMFLYATHAEAKKRNQIKRELLPGNDLVFSMTQLQRMGSDGERETHDGPLDKHRRKLTLRMGAKCRLTCNYGDPGRGFVNGALCELVALCRIDEITVTATSSTGQPEGPRVVTQTSAVPLAPDIESAMRANLFSARLPAGSDIRLLDGRGMSLEWSGDGGVRLSLVKTGDGGSVYAAENTHPFHCDPSLSRVKKYHKADGASRGKNLFHEEASPNLLRHYCPVVRFAHTATAQNAPYYVLPPALFTRAELVHGAERALVTQAQLPLVLAYASTIHSAQGLTLDAVALSAPVVMEPALIYVALTRAISANAVYITGPLALWQCTPNRAVVMFYRMLTRMRELADRKYPAA